MTVSLASSWASSVRLRFRKIFAASLLRILRSMARSCGVVPADSICDGGGSSLISSEPVSCDDDVDINASATHVYSHTECASSVSVCRRWCGFDWPSCSNNRFPGAANSLDVPIDDAVVC